MVCAQKHSGSSISAYGSVFVLLIIDEFNIWFAFLFNVACMSFWTCDLSFG